MRLVTLGSYGTALLVAQAALDAAPVIVAEREGGMGLGSALIAATLLGVSALAAGAVLGAVLVDRGSPGLAVLAGAVVAYAGLLGIGTAPMGVLGWLMIAFGLLGAGLGLVMTAAFAAAAGSGHASRPIAVATLLAAMLVSRALAPTIAAIGTLALLVTATMLIALSVASARAGRDRRLLLPAVAGTSVTLRTTAAGAALVFVGTVALMGGADPSRVSAFVLAGHLGVHGIQALDMARVAMLAAGAVTVLAGGALLVRAGLQRPLPRSAGLLGLTTLAASGVGAAVNRISLYAIDGSAATALVTAGLLSGAIGLLVATWWLMRLGRPRLPAAVGASAALLASAIVAVAVLAGVAPSFWLLVAATALAGAGIGATAVAMRLALADAPPGRRGLAAGVGVAAATIGSALGILVGSSAGASAGLGYGGASVPAAAVLVLAAAAAVAGSAGLPSARPERREVTSLARCGRSRHDERVGTSTRVRRRRRPR